MKKAVKVRAYIYPTKEILEKDVVPEKGWSLSGVLKGMKEALKVYGGSERKNWKDNDIKIVKVFEDGTEEEISLKDSVLENKRKELREMYDRLYDVLTEGANADIPNNIKKAYDMVGGRCYFHEKKPTFLSVEGKVGDYTLTNVISLNESLYGDLNRLASDLTMAYAKSKGIDPEMRTPDFIRSLKDEKVRKVAEDALSGVTPYAMRMKRQNEREAIETQLSEIEHLIDLREDFLESDKADNQPEEVLNRIMKQIKYLNIKKSELTKKYEDLFSQEYGYWEIGDSKKKPVKDGYESLNLPDDYKAVYNHTYSPDGYDYDEEDEIKHMYFFYIHGDISTEISNGTLSESELFDVKYMCFNKFADEFLDTFEKHSDFDCDISELGIELSDNVEEENEFDFIIDTETEEYTEQELKKMFDDVALFEKTYSGDTESGVHYECKIKVINIVYNGEKEYTD